MIKKIRLISDLGKFDSVSSGADIPLERMTVIYAENGRGKTTLSAILRSLATGDPIPIIERRRLTSQGSPHVVLDCDDAQQPAVFENDSWNRTVPAMVVFDDLFVDQNVYSGLAVGPGHRQNLHELILGSRGVNLNEHLQNLVARIETHNSELRTKSAAIPVAERGSLSVDEFCALAERTTVDEDIEEAQRKLTAVLEQDSVRTTPRFDPINLSGFDLAGLELLLASDLPSLDVAAAASVRAHFDGLSEGHETWVAEGMVRLETAPDDQRSGLCPFCAQALSGSPVIEHYRAYFSDAYRDLKASLDTTLSQVTSDHGADAITEFQRGVRLMSERRFFWDRFCDLPDLSIDADAITRDWRDALDVVERLLAAKQLALLERMELSPTDRLSLQTYEIQRQVIASMNQRIEQANLAIDVVQSQAASGNTNELTANLTQFQSVKSRHSLNIATLCEAYLQEKDAKTQTESERDRAKVSLDRYRESEFPGYQMAINEYLARFNAGFRLEQITPADTRGGPTCTYNVMIDDVPVAVAGGDPTPGEPTFRNTLSAGDRNTLALAFFFASLDRDQDLASKIVVFDDPVTSLDEHRSLTTVQEIRRLAERSQQVIALSHRKNFLIQVWDKSSRSNRAAIEIKRSNSGSTITEWDVNEDSATEHDRRHSLLRGYLESGTADTREIAESIRHVLEGFLRVAFPEHFPPGTLLGPFKNRCTQRVGGQDEIMSSQLTQNLDDLTEYANLFHHETNPLGWETVVINDGELRGFVERTLIFARR